MFHQKLLSYMKKYWREIAYYACVMLVLGAVAWGAEAYRNRRDAAAEIPAAVAAQALQVQSEPQFALPQGMQLRTAFSSRPVWNAQQGCWQAHPAADFACAGGAVRSFSEGTVTTIGQSGVCGGFIEVESGEVLLRYCSVLPAPGMKTGIQVKKGDVIAAADGSMPGEAQTNDHVHLEAFRGGRPADVMKLLETSD